MGIVSTIKNISPALNRLRILALIVTILVVPFVLYYLIIVRSQTAYFTERSFRKLSLVGSQIASKVESVGFVLKNNSEKFSRQETFDPADPNNVEHLKKVFAALKDDGSQIVPLSIETVPAEQKKSQPTISVNAGSQESDGPKLYVSTLAELADKSAPK
jgi:hypothetical protein